MRRAYGVRLRMLHERAALWAEAKELDAEAFCLVGATGKAHDHVKEDDPGDHVVNILAYKMAQEGMGVDECLKLAEKLLRN